MSESGLGYYMSDREPGWGKFERRTPVVFSMVRIGMKADLAFRIIERWASVAGVPDGEDSAGRAKLRLQECDEVVQRAVTCAELAFGEFEKRGWLLKLPEPESIATEDEPMKA